MQNLLDYSKIKIDIEILRMWIEALRGGEYKQGKGKLKYFYDSKYYFCCLGVLNEICTQKFLNYQNKDTNKIDSQNWFNVGFDLFTTQSKLMYMNDSWDRSFNEIADYIEHSYKAYTGKDLFETAA